VTGALLPATRLATLDAADWADFRRWTASRGTSPCPARPARCRLPPALAERTFIITRRAAGYDPPNDSRGDRHPRGTYSASGPECTPLPLIQAQDAHVAVYGAAACVSRPTRCLLGQISGWIHSRRGTKRLRSLPSPEVETGKEQTFGQSLGGMS
jgi:hypothetical protein